MKLGCLATLAVMGVIYTFYSRLLPQTPFADQTWIPILFSICSGAIAGNIHGLILALSQKNASATPRSEWKDGSLVVVSGKIQTTRSPIQAPFSGTPSAIVEYSVKPPRDTHNATSSSRSKAADQFSGFMMAPCSVYTTQGSINLIGFPLMGKLAPRRESSSTSYQRAGEFLKSATFHKMEGNPIAMIKQLNEVFKDTDGDVQSNFRKANSRFNVDEMEAAEISEELLANGFILEETLVESGAEVTATGTYRANKQAIDIGGGFQALSHGIQLGTAAKNSAVAIFSAIGCIVFFGGAFAAGHLFLVGKLLPFWE